ncbi:uncharacterized protein LOC131928195 [Physella acuta]|uniref:uncharacterized protein LOC131928195 n=1 Tax=Physella acuta TaxID=109671 RepID=UPI0027DCA3F8|nr:uncharacterized protein LOC131928195 [Physella acuta]
MVEKRPFVYNVEKLISDTKEFYVTDDVARKLYIVFNISCHGILATVGAVTNLINMVIFLKLGLKDSMSVGVFALSFTDFLVTCFQMAGSCSFLANIIYPECPVCHTLGMYIFSWAGYITYLISCWITTVISLERCVCVIAPFTVKVLFTRKRCVLTIVAIYCVHITIHIPMFALVYVEWDLTEQFKDNTENLTSPREENLRIVSTDNSAEWEIISDLIAGVVLSLISQAIIFVCSFWMIYELKKSSKFRSVKKEKNYKSSEKFPNQGLVYNRHIEAGNSSVLERPNAKGDNLSPREKRLVKVVVFLAINLSVCNVPRFVTTAVWHVIPGMNVGAYYNLSTLLWELAYMFGTLCCTSNFFVYYILNSNFRKSFKDIYFNSPF